MTIDVLPDVALLDIFDFYLAQEHIEAWHTLVHVCRKWRNVVFGSPRRLNLRLYYSSLRDPMKEMLDIWPAFPIVIMIRDPDINWRWSIYNIIEALAHNDRICELELTNLPSPQLYEVLPAMQFPFPALKTLRFGPVREIEVNPVFQPDSFLGGSTPRLQSLMLDCISFPELPKLLLSATHLVSLELRKIPRSGYISPEALVTGLSGLTCLESLDITFESPLFFPDQNSPRLPPQTRTLLPALTQLWFIGVCEYLEHLVAQIDAPLLDRFGTTFLPQQIFDTAELTQFITRAPNFEAYDEAAAEACMAFSCQAAGVTFSQGFEGELGVGISSRQPDLQLSYLPQICRSSFARTFIPIVESLYIDENDYPPELPPLEWPDDIEGNQWLELLHPFTAVKDLYISWELELRIALALKELVGDSVVETLPALQTLFLEEPPWESSSSGPVQEAIGQFVAARQLAGHPITTSRCKFKVR